jgi:hypothetical protein
LKLTFQFSDGDKRREELLKKMFAEEGCDDQHLSEQPVTGSNCSASSACFRALPARSSSKDRLSAMHLDGYYQTYILLEAYLAFLDQALDIEPALPPA